MKFIALNSPFIIEGVGNILIPDAQGNVHEEELHYAAVFSFLESKSYRAAARFSELFDSIIGTGIPPVETSGAKNISLQRLVCENLIDEQYVAILSKVTARDAIQQ